MRVYTGGEKDKLGRKREAKKKGREVVYKLDWYKWRVWHISKQGWIHV